jgi:putative DNA primase/helicase
MGDLLLDDRRAQKREDGWYDYRRVVENYLTGECRMAWIKRKESGMRVGEEDVVPVVTGLDTIHATEVRWLWDQVIPLGKLTIICGDPGLGKSFLTLDLAARVSGGYRFPEPGGGGFGDGGGEAGGVVLISAEDDPADTIKPRLVKMRGDPERVVILNGFLDGRGRSHDFVIGENINGLEKLLDQRPDIRLLVVDPVSAFVGPADSYNNAAVRVMLKPLSELAGRRGVAVVLVTHLKKGDASRALYRAMGSLAFTAAARVVLMVVRDPADHDRRMVLPVKSNIGDDRTGYAYRIIDGAVVWDTETISGNADEVLAANGAANQMGSVMERRYGALRDTLHVFLAPEPKPVREVETLVAGLGHRWRTVAKPEIREVLGVHARKIGNEWYWEIRKPGAKTGGKGES